MFCASTDGLEATVSTRQRPMRSGPTVSKLLIWAPPVAGQMSKPKPAIRRFVAGSCPNSNRPSHP